ncbi:MAG: hypothetical protein HY849_03465 [Nitrosomonadales bacterium]|nr:hypothetical protein [Nitrosomonadales bacterium]
MNQFARLLFVSAVLGASGVRAEPLDGLPEGVQAHGFVSQSVVSSNQNRIGGSKSGSLGTDMRELGGNLSWRPNADWLVSAQLLSRWAGASDNGNVRVDYAFVDRLLVNAEGARLGARIGKIKNPFGFYNTTRDVAHTRSSILLPQSIYHDQVRNFFLAAPGASLYGGLDGTENSLEWEVSVMQPEVRDGNLTAFMVDQQTGRFKGRPSVLAHALWEGDGGRMRAGLSAGSLAMRFQPAPQDFFGLVGLMGGTTGAGDITLNTGVFSLQYNAEDWSHTAEYAVTRQLRKNFNLPGPLTILDMDSTVEALYLQTEWRFASRWKAFLRYDTLVLDKSDRNGQRFAAATGLPAAQRYARDWASGLRYDPTSAWSLFAEVHHVNGGAWVSKLDNLPVNLATTWDMLLLQAAWRF